MKKALEEEYAIHRCVKARNKYMKDYDKNEESSYLKYYEVNNLYGLAMPQKLSVSKIEWVKDNFHFNEDSIKHIMKTVMKDFFSKLMFNILKYYMNFIIIYHFYLTEWKLKLLESLRLIYMIKLNTLFI